MTGTLFADVNPATCDERCTSATSKSCGCSKCGGRYHGINAPPVAARVSRQPRGEPVHAQPTTQLGLPLAAVSSADDVALQQSDPVADASPVVPAAAAPQQAPAASQQWPELPPWRHVATCLVVVEWAKACQAAIQENRDCPARPPVGAPGCRCRRE